MRFLFLLSVFFISSSHAYAKSYSTMPADGHIVFKASALGLKFEGKGEGARGILQGDGGVSGKLEFNLNSLDTGLTLRNSHMKDKYLETEKFPITELSLLHLKNFNEEAEIQETEFDGLLTLRGVQKSIQSGRARIEKVENGYRVVASFSTKMSDFAIPIPKYAGVVVKDEIQIEANLHFSSQAQ